MSSLHINKDTIWYGPNPLHVSSGELPYFRFAVEASPDISEILGGVKIVDGDHKVVDDLSDIFQRAGDGLFHVQLQWDNPSPGDYGPTFYAIAEAEEDNTIACNGVTIDIGGAVVDTVVVDPDCECECTKSDKPDAPTYVSGSGSNIPGPAGSYGPTSGFPLPMVQGAPIIPGQGAPTQAGHLANGAPQIQGAPVQSGVFNGVPYTLPGVILVSF